ncbi:MAG TPA: hypothetical protein PKX92_13120 [Edaphocola sp.]|nr:hypothetical protein [Edaphocola sp.]
MFEEIPYFLIIEKEAIKSIQEDKIILKETIDFANRYGKGVFEHAYFCLMPPGLGLYEIWYWEDKHFRRFGEYDDFDPRDPYDDYHKPVIPINELLKQSLFVQLDDLEQNTTLKYKILRKENGSVLLNYWLNKNHFTDFDQWHSLGIGKGIFNLMPNHHNYFDRNLICTCGEEGCFSQHAWYVKYENSFAIPFLSYGHNIIFDLHELDWEEEDYDEDKCRANNNYFPFRYEESDFQLIEKLVIPNGKALDIE